MDVSKRTALISEISDPHIHLEESPRPLQALFNLVKNANKTSLRQSTDDDALIGYKTLADEIAETPGLGSVFIGTSSGTTAEALARRFAETKKTIAVNIIQTPDISPIAKELGAKLTPTTPETSLATAIVDKAAHRKDTLVALLQKTSGAGFIVSNDDIRQAQTLLRDHAGIEATGNGALGLAGLIHALAQGTRPQGSVVCIITGK